MPVAMGVGVILMLLGMTMIVRSQDDRQNAIALSDRTKGLSIAEVGITRTQSLFQRAPELARLPYDHKDSSQSNAWVQYLEKEVCGTTLGEVIDVDQIIDDWVPVANTGHFKIIGYEPPGTGETSGTLRVVGTNDITSIQDNNPEKSLQAVVVDIPVVSSPPIGQEPALWVATFDAPGNGNLGGGNQKINGNVQTKDCEVTSGLFDKSKNLSDLKKWKLNIAPALDFPPLPLLPSHISSALTPSQLCGSKNCQLPRSGDNPDPGTPNIYSYLVTDLDIGNNSLSVSSGSVVRLYVQGNIDLKGNAGIKGETNALQIYGSNGKGVNGPAMNYAVAGDTKIYETSELKISGTADIYAFIFAPAAMAGINGGGNGLGIFGAIWINTWAGPPFGSNSNKNVVNLPTSFNWSLLPSTLQNSFSKIQPITAWRQEADPFRTSN